MHRDLKPENIFLARTKRRDDAWTVKLLDFGIAKILDDARGAGTTAPAGTPLWMAPEQTEAHGKITPATDVWALGLIAFRIVTGRYFWRVANGAQSIPAGALLREVLIDPIDAAAARAAELGVTSALPPGFDAWFARCVERSSEARFPDAGAAGAAFEAIAAAASHEALDATLPGPIVVAPSAAAITAAAPPSTQAGRRSRVGAVAAVVAAVAVAIVIGALALRAKHPPVATAERIESGVTRPIARVVAGVILDAPPPSTAELGRRMGLLEDIIRSPNVSPEMKTAAAEKLAHMESPGIPPMDIQLGVREQVFPITRKCYEAELKKHPDLVARIDVSFAIRADGTVKNPINAEATGVSSAFETCILRAFRNATFPKPLNGEPISVRYPIAFSPGL